MSAEEKVGPEIGDAQGALAGQLAIGPDAAGNLLEIIWLELRDRTPIVIHAMPLRRIFYDLLPQGGDEP